MSTRRIVIEDGIARTEDVNVISVSGMASVLPTLRTTAPSRLPVLPMHTAAWEFNPDAKSGKILVGRPPQIVTLKIDGPDLDPDDPDEHWWPADEDADQPTDDNGYRHFRVAVPWAYFLFTFNTTHADFNAPGNMVTLYDTYLYRSQRRVVAEDDRLLSFQLPNVDSASAICWGNVGSEQGSFAGRIDSRVNDFFDTNFNADLELNTPYWGYREWERRTQRDENCWTYWGWDHGMRVSDIMSLHVGMPTVREGWAPPPERFTVGQARDWALTAPADARRRLLTGVRRALESIEPTAQDIDEAVEEVTA